MATYRGVRARLGQSLALFAMGALTVAGCVASAGYSRVTHISAGSAGALVLLGIVALAIQARTSVRARRQEIALAQLRGRHGVALLWSAVAEPALILVVATGAGTAIGDVVARAAVRRWVGAATPFSMTASEWGTAAVVLVVGLAVVVMVSWRPTYEPLTAKLDNRDRPRPMTSATLFMNLLVLLGAAASVYQARQHGPRHADWVTFLSPALVGLAAGQVGVWCVALVARLAITSPRLNQTLGWFLTLRRLTRRADGVATIRVVVAAVVVAGVAASAWVGSQGWRDQMARVATGGPIAFDVPAGGLRAYVASHEADPHGQWLMAMAASPDPTAGSDRDVFVDTARWDRVVGSFFEGTPVAGVSGSMSALSTTQAVRPATGSGFAMTFTARSVREAWPVSNRATARQRKYDGLVALQFTVDYVDDSGNLQSLTVPRSGWQKPAPVRPGVVGYSVSAAGCDGGCAVKDVSVQGLVRKGALRITGMSFGDTRLLSVEAGDLEPPAGTRLQVEPVRGALTLSGTDPYSPHELLTWRRDSPPAALVTPGLRLEKSGGVPQAYGTDGEAIAIQVAAQVQALPLLGKAGILLDLGQALRGAGGQVPGNHAIVVARADTPAPILNKLRATGAVARQTTVEQARTEMRRADAAQGTWLYALVAGFTLLIAVVSTVSSTAEQRRTRRSEAAALRVVGVDITDVARGYRGEAEVLGVTVTVVAGVAVWFGCRALVAALPLVDAGSFGLPLDVTPSLDLVAGLAVVAGSFVAFVVFFGFRLVGRSSPPSLLRGEDR